jgi:PAS domain S-box-containing protein
MNTIEMAFTNHQGVATVTRESTLLEALHDAVFATDLYGVITQWSRGAERTFGYLAAEAIGLPLTFLRFPDDLSRHRETVIAPAIEHGLNTLTMRTRRKDRSAIVIELRLATVRGENGAIAQLIGCANALYELPSVDPQFEALSDRPSAADVVWQLVSEINTPLAAIVNYASGLAVRLRAREFDPTELEDAAHRLQHETLRAATVVRRWRDRVTQERKPKL